MRSYDWGQLFPEHILDRGRDYGENGQVDLLSCVEGLLKARVYGTDVYDVRIRLHGNEVDEMFCTCPYAAKGLNCKHMAAVLFDWFEGDPEEDPDEDETGDDEEDASALMVEKTDGDAVARMVRKADEDTVRRFLIDILKENPALEERFQAAAESGISDAEMSRYKQELDKIVYYCAGPDGYISYRRASMFRRQVSEFLRERVLEVLDNGYCASAFKLSSYVFETICEVEMDDSDGEIGDLAEELLDVWNVILQKADMPLQEEMYDWFVGQMDNTAPDYMEEYLVQILMDGFDLPQFTRKLLDLSEEKVEQAEKYTGEGLCGYDMRCWAERHLELLERSNADWGTIEDYCRKRWRVPEVRSYYVKQMRARGEYDAAIDALNESLVLDQGLAGLIRREHRQLKEIYRECGRETEYRRELREMFLEQETGSLELFRELKALTPAQEWESVRDELLAELPGTAPLADLYAEEKLYDRLMSTVRGGGYRRIYLLDKYAEVLAEQYAEEVLDLYAEELEKKAVYAAGRKSYQEWAQTLRKMKKLPGGKERVRGIVGRWRMIYGNRPAMMEELSGV